MTQCRVPHLNVNPGLESSWTTSINPSRLKSDGSNFGDWEAAVRNAAVADGKLIYLIEPLPPKPTPNAGANELLKYSDFVMEAGAVKNVLIFAMETPLQRRFIAHGANKIFTTLTNEFSKSPRIVTFELTSRFFEAKLQRGQAVGPHILNMIENVEKLDALDCRISQNIVLDRMLHSLHDGFALFRANYYMNDLRKSPHELHSLLVQTEKDLRMSGSVKQDVLLIPTKSRGKGKAPGNLAVGVPKFKGPGKTKSGPGETSRSLGKAKSKVDNVECHHCHKSGHWRRNCPVYREDIKAGRVFPVGMSSYIHVIEINHASYGTWVHNTDYVSHWCNLLQAP